VHCTAPVKVLHYVANHGDRLVFVDDLSAPEWREPEFILNTPRAIAFLDLPPKIKIIPMAVECEDSKILRIFNKFEGERGQRPPEYPEDLPGAEFKEKRKEYWTWINENVSAFNATAAVEEAVAAAKSQIGLSSKSL